MKLVRAGRAPMGDARTNEADEAAAQDAMTKFTIEKVRAAVLTVTLVSEAWPLTWYWGRFRISHSTSSAR